LLFSLLGAGYALGYALLVPITLVPASAYHWQLPTLTRQVSRVSRPTIDHTRHAMCSLRCIHRYNPASRHPLHHPWPVILVLHCISCLPFYYCCIGKGFSNLKLMEGHTKKKVHQSFDHFSSSLMLFCNDHPEAHPTVPTTPLITEKINDVFYIFYWTQ
jgi:hypothetical protein